MTVLISERTVTARKPHPCSTCTATAVQPGDTYQRVVYTYDGHIYSWISCQPCDEISGDVWDWWGQPEEGCGRDSYIEWAEENLADPRAVAFLHRVGLVRSQP